jgi:murein DD-endopeptidase MepM/ murein hydrolase activator NlpD
MVQGLVKVGLALGVLLSVVMFGTAVFDRSRSGIAPAGDAAAPSPSRARSSATPASLADRPHVPLAVEVEGTDLDRLRVRALKFPVPGVDMKTVRDDFADSRGARAHEAIDILAPRGTPVLAVDDGTVARLFKSARGGITVYQFDPTQSFCYYYAHLDRYAFGLREGNAVRKGDVIGYVGTTGNAPPGTPHLHFTIFKLGPEKRWWEGVPVNPYSLWVPSA